MRKCSMCSMKLSTEYYISRRFNCCEIGTSSIILLYNKCIISDIGICENARCTWRHYLLSTISVDDLTAVKLVPHLSYNNAING